MLYNEIIQLFRRDYASEHSRLGRNQSQSATGYRDNLYFAAVGHAAGMVTCADRVLAKRPRCGDRCFASGPAAYRSGILSAHGHEPDRTGRPFD